MGISAVLGPLNLSEFLPLGLHPLHALWHVLLDKSILFWWLQATKGQHWAPWPRCLTTLLPSMPSVWNLAFRCRFGKCSASIINEGCCTACGAEHPMAVNNSVSLTLVSFNLQFPVSLLIECLGCAIIRIQARELNPDLPHPNLTQSNFLWGKRSGLHRLAGRSQRFPANHKGC